MALVGRFARRSVVTAIRVYQVTLSPMFPPACRFAPSCSVYAVEAVERHGVAKGGWLAVRRLLRCHPWGAAGVDEVPTAVR